ncbi:MAG: hypothetical protein VKJ06_02890 [Vampirovibrionales bacterium]|nr:hypothetical protein [Vampirovibrionales bacterium]
MVQLNRTGVQVVTKGVYLRDKSSIEEARKAFKKELRAIWLKRHLEGVPCKIVSTTMFDPPKFFPRSLAGFVKNGPSRRLSSDGHEAWLDAAVVTGLKNIWTLRGLNLLAPWRDVLIGTVDTHTYVSENRLPFILTNEQLNKIESRLPKWFNQGMEHLLEKIHDYGMSVETYMSQNGIPQPSRRGIKA